MNQYYLIIVLLRELITREEPVCYGAMRMFEFFGDLTILELGIQKKKPLCRQKNVLLNGECEKEKQRSCRKIYRKNEFKIEHKL